MNSLRDSTKLTAFTLLELLVGMVVSGIVVGAVFTAFHIVSRQAINYENRVQVSQELSLFHSILSTDASAADSVYCEENQSLVLFSGKNGTLTGIHYEFSGQYILRKNGGHIDTIRVELLECKQSGSGIQLRFAQGDHDEDIFVPTPRAAKSGIPNP